jgi:hypothetical protein
MPQDRDTSMIIRDIHGNVISPCEMYTLNALGITEFDQPQGADAEAADAPSVRPQP